MRYFLPSIGLLNEEGGHKGLYGHIAGIITLKGDLLLSETVIGNPDEIRGYDPLHYIDDWKEYLYSIDSFIRFPGKKMEKEKESLQLLHLSL